MPDHQNQDQAATFPWLDKYPHGIDWDRPIEARTVYSMLSETVAKFGTRPAFDFLGKKWSWAEIGHQVERMARGLQDMGVRKGDRIGLFLPNTPYYLVSYYAIARIGAIVVNFNPLYAERELAHQIEDSEIDIMVTVDLKLTCDKLHTMLHDGRLKQVILCRFADILPFPKNILFPIVKCAEQGHLPDRDNVTWYHKLVHNDGNPAPVDIDPREDIAVLQYTGGTTGTPKGAMLTHVNIAANVEQSLRWFSSVRPGEERMLGVLPFFHVFAMTCVMNFSVRAGLEIIALPRFELKQTLKLIHKRKPHYMPAVPAIYNAINSFPDLRRYDLKSLKACISGGAPMPVEVKRIFEANTGCVVVEGYGLTESSPVVCANPIVGENRPGSIGLPLPDTIVEVADLEDKSRMLPPGERGELCVRGPQVMKGYWKKPDETEKTLMGGRLYTGDIAIIEPDGYVRIVDRLKDMIITNGYNVYPRNVEEAIYLHKDVEECIVAGVPDEARGEIVKAWIKLKPGARLDEDQLKSFLKTHLSPMEMPRQVEFRDKPLPKTLIGKLSRKDILAEEMAGKAPA